LAHHGSQAWSCPGNTKGMFQPRLARRSSPLCQWPSHPSISAQNC